jgi:enoyl-CoA hydratase/carnithine racemase
MTDYEFIRYEKRDHVAWVTMNRPEVRNALNSQCHVEMRSAFEDFRDDDNLWVAILTGAGDKAFSAGADLKEAAISFAEGGSRSTAGDSAAGGSAATSARAGRPVPPVPPVPWGGITARWECWKPIIAAVNGFALGGGTELALCCDLIVAADTARFGLPEPRRGILAAAGGLVRLPRQLPLKQAMELILTGSSISADEAKALGLVNRVVALADLHTAAAALADEIMQCSPVSVRLSKQIAMSYLSLPLEDALAAQATEVGQLRSSPDAAEGTRAFAEKRAPIWSGA